MNIQVIGDAEVFIEPADGHLQSGKQPHHFYLVFKLFGQSLFPLFGAPMCPQYSQLPKSWRNPQNLEISLGEGFCGSRGDAAFSLCLG